MIKNVLAASVVAIVSFGSFAASQTTTLATNDPDMAIAVKNAQETLPLFLDNVLDADGYADPSASIMVSFSVKIDGKTGFELIWVGPFMRRADGMFAGDLANQPTNLGNLNKGDAIRVPESLIQDWSVRAPSGTYHGSYTLREIARRAGVVNSKLHPDVLPMHWR